MFNQAGSIITTATTKFVLNIVPHVSYLVHWWLVVHYFCQKFSETIVEYMPFTGKELV